MYEKKLYVNGQNYIIEKSCDEQEICRAVLLLGDLHTPPILSMVSDIKEYANKLVNNGEILLIKSEQMDKTEPAGIIAAYANDKNTHKAYVSLLIIAKDFQHKGLGKELLSRMEEIAKMKGMKEIDLEVRKINKMAVKFYDSCGYSICGENENSFYIRKSLLDPKSEKVGDK